MTLNLEFRRVLIHSKDVNDRRRKWCSPSICVELIECGQYTTRVVWDVSCDDRYYAPPDERMPEFMCASSTPCITTALYPGSLWITAHYQGLSASVHINHRHVEWPPKQRLFDTIEYVQWIGNTATIIVMVNTGDVIELGLTSLSK